MEIQRDVKRDVKGKFLRKIEKEKVIELLEKGLSTKQIAKELNVLPVQITMFKQHNKLANSRSDLIKLTYEEEQVIIGSILGDGCIEINNKERGYYRLCIKHSIKQEDYITFKHSLLKRFSNKLRLGIKKDNRERFKDSSYIELRTSTNKIFKKYRENWYKEGKKRIYKEDLFKLDWLGIAIWIMDDGYYSVNSITLCTDCFSEKDLLLIQEFFLTKGLKTTIQKPGRIRFSSETFNILKENVVKYFPENMLYKVRVKQGELLETPIDVSEDNQQPSINSNVFEGSTTNSRVLSDNTEDSNADTSALQSFIDKQKLFAFEENQIISENFWDLI